MRTDGSSEPEKPPSTALGHHTHWTAPDHARPSGAEPLQLIVTSIRERGCGWRGRGCASSASAPSASVAAAGTRTPRSPRPAPSSAMWTARLARPGLRTSRPARRGRRSSTRPNPSPVRKLAARHSDDTLAGRSCPRAPEPHAATRRPRVLPRHRPARPPPAGASASPAAAPRTPGAADRSRRAGGRDRPRSAGGRLGRRGPALSFNCVEQGRSAGGAVASRPATTASALPTSAPRASTSCRAPRFSPSCGAALSIAALVVLDVVGLALGMYLALVLRQLVRAGRRRSLEPALARGPRGVAEVRSRRSRFSSSRRRASIASGSGGPGRAASWPRSSSLR